MTDRCVSISTMNALGRRLRQRGIHDSDRDLLEAVLADHFRAQREVQEALRTQLPNLSFTPRLKTEDTIVDKLRRERTMAFARMRDIAGVRIVERMNRVEQDVLVKQVAEVLGQCHVVDRRANPSFGYRAVHLEHIRRGLYVEIQVRTGLQDQWAQIVERLADVWGRQVRYGGTPDHPARVISSDGSTRSDLWGLVQDFAEIIDQVEVLEAAGPTDDDSDGSIRATSGRNLEALLERMYDVARREEI